mmetsp:Transcript_13942/g.37416  ORF Transcript_13942/g.37416 Transcript_13942/m.37416 type:complete len:253 (-) Transcript_13942:1190-1948(-)
MAFWRSRMYLSAARIDASSSFAARSAASLIARPTVPRRTGTSIDFTFFTLRMARFFFSGAVSAGETPLATLIDPWPSVAAPSAGAGAISESALAAPGASTLLLLPASPVAAGSDGADGSDAVASIGSSPAPATPSGTGSSISISRSSWADASDTQPFASSRTFSRNFEGAASAVGAVASTAKSQTLRSLIVSSSYWASIASGPVFVNVSDLSAGIGLNLPMSLITSPCESASDAPGGSFTTSIAYGVTSCSA